jgi:hypothetical protein
MDGRHIAQPGNFLDLVGVDAKDGVTEQKGGDQEIVVDGLRLSVRHNDFL